MNPQIYMVMPTWNNVEMCADAVRTLYEYTDFAKYGKLLVVDNSPIKHPHLKMMCALWGADYYAAYENLGWMASINYGFGVMNPMPYFTMCNDDVVFPQDPGFWPRTLGVFEDPSVGGVGPVSNYVMGWQQNRIALTDDLGSVELLVGFCATYRTSVLEEVGALDLSLPGGDDLDLSIRVRKAGYKLICDRRSFLYHYGSVTGNRVHSDWDNLQSQHRTLNAIIRKHGMIAWYNCTQGPWTTYGEPIIEPELQDIVLKAVAEIGAHVEARAQIVEGSSPPRELMFLAREAQRATTIAETGLNAGMSACAMLTANPTAQVVSFDRGDWRCAEIAETYLADEFWDRHQVVWGDSKDTLPVWQGQFDFAFIDGGHDTDTAYSDIWNLAPRSRRVMIDDTRVPSVMLALERAMREGLLTDVREYCDRTTSVPRYWVLAKGGRG